MRNSSDVMSNGRVRRVVQGLVMCSVLAVSCAAYAQSGQTALVVPFRNLTQQADDAWIGGGIAASVTSDLRNLGMDVLRDQLDGDLPDQSLLTASREAGARWLITGGYQRVARGPKCFFGTRYFLQHATESFLNCLNTVLRP